MKSNLLKELSKFNSRQSKASFVTYRTFLCKMLSTTEFPQAAKALELVQREDWNGLVDYADCLSSTVFQTAREHRVCNQIAAVIRKYPFPDGLMNVDPKEAAMEKFLASEHHCKRVNQRFRLYRTCRSPNEATLQKARSYIQYVLGPFWLPDMMDGCAFGAGASIGTHGDATNLARKVLGERWSVSSGAYYYARSVLKCDIHVHELLNGVSTRSQFSVDPSLFNEAYDTRAKIVDYNKIAFVPKTVRVHRTIAVEPLLNGYLQKGVDTYLRKRLKRVGIDLSDQERNKEGARIGSLNWTSDDAFATIDLSSASDSISTELVRTLLPPEWFEYLRAIRSPSYELDGKVYPYHKFASMGNGFCFPLESLIFASLCAASYSEQSLTPDFLVYGDDLIVRKSVFQPLVQLLRTCGFRVNSAKTFNTGPFRESCGADWFSGEDVRPIYLDYALDSLQSIFKFCNMSRSKEHTAVLFGEALQYLESLVPTGLCFARPYSGNADTALQVPWDVFMASPFSRYSQKLQAWSWMEIMSTPEPDTLVRRAARYDLALIMGALRGSKSSCPFPLRFTARTKIRRVSYAGGWSIALPGFIAGRAVFQLP